MPTQAKTETIESLKTRLSGIDTAVLTEYRGLTVQQLSELRKQLKTASAEYRVVKNRLARLALTGSPLDCLGPHLKGPTGLVLGRKDPVAVAKTLSVFARANPTLQIKLGYVQGKLLNPAELRALADLPSREVLLGQVVGALQSPLSRLVSVLGGMLRGLVSALDQIRQGKEAHTAKGAHTAKEAHTL